MAKSILDYVFRWLSMKFLTVEQQKESDVEAKKPTISKEPASIAVSVRVSETPPRSGAPTCTVTSGPSSAPPARRGPHRAHPPPHRAHANVPRNRGLSGRGDGPGQRQQPARTFNDQRRSSRTPEVLLARPRTPGTDAYAPARPGARPGCPRLTARPCNRRLGPRLGQPHHLSDARDGPILRVRRLRAARTKIRTALATAGARGADRKTEYWGYYD
jgi:hypothetical protein